METNMFPKVKTERETNFGEYIPVLTFYTVETTTRMCAIFETAACGVYNIITMYAGMNEWSTSWAIYGRVQQRHKTCAVRSGHTVYAYDGQI